MIITAFLCVSMLHDVCLLSFLFTFDIQTLFTCSCRSQSVEALLQSVESSLTVNASKDETQQAIDILEMHHLQSSLHFFEV